MAKTCRLSADSSPMGWIRPYVRQWGNERRPAWRLSSRRLLDYLLVYIADGRGVFEVGSKRWEARPGDLFWIPPNTLHAMEGFAPSMMCPFIHFDLIYRPGVSDWNFTIPEGMTDLKRHRKLMHLPVADVRIARLSGLLEGFNNRRVGQLIVDICAEEARGQPYARLRTSGLVVEIVAEILRGREGLSGDYGAHVRGLEESADFLREHCEEDLKIPEIATICGLSPSHFRRVFGILFGCSPREFQRRSRIAKAKQLMLGSTLNFSQISQMVGFATIHSFSRAFASVDGVSPTRYRVSAAGLTKGPPRAHRYIGEGPE